MNDLNLYHHDKHSPGEVAVDEKEQAPWLYLLQKYSGSLNGASILDVGCGLGGFVLSCYKLEANPTGIEPSQLVHVTRKGIISATGRSLPLVCADGRKLPFKADSFDIVVSIGVLEHITRPEDLVNEMARVLKPGGTFFLIFGPNKRLRFTQSSAHKAIVCTYWTPGDAEKLMRALQLSPIHRVWAEDVQYRFQNQCFSFGHRKWLDTVTGVLINGAKKSRFVGFIVAKICRALEIMSLSRNVCLMATKRKDGSHTEDASLSSSYYAGKREDLAKFLICPACRGDLELNVEELDSEEVISGSLFCKQCNCQYPIVDAVPDFICQE